MALLRSWRILALLCGIVSVPSPVSAQQAVRLPRVGLLRVAVSFAGEADLVPQWLTELGYEEGRNIAFERRFATKLDELPRVAAELVELKVDVIVTAGIPAIRAAQGATRTIPIVMATPSDPARAGLVTSLARPGGNVTGVTATSPELSGKRLQLLREALPGLTRVGVLWNPTDPDKAAEWSETQAAAQVVGVKLMSLEVRAPTHLEGAFQAVRKERAGALIVLTDRLILGRALAIADLATKHRLPTMYGSRWFVEGGGGLMSYGPSTLDLGRRLASYVDRILKGAKPADLPVEEPTRFELVINLRTAKALGLTIPQSLLLRADHVIE